MHVFHVYSHENFMLALRNCNFHILKLHRKTILQQISSSDKLTLGTPTSFFYLVWQSALEKTKTKIPAFKKQKKYTYHRDLPRISQEVVTNLVRGHHSCALVFNFYNLYAQSQCEHIKATKKL